MNVSWELEDLEKVFRRYGYETVRWLIPTRNAHLRLTSKVVEVVEAIEEKRDGTGLVIVYYAGHAFVNERRMSTWCW